MSDEIVLIQNLIYEIRGQVPTGFHVPIDRRGSPKQPVTICDRIKQKRVCATFCLY